jgi:catechol 2,3-dioxygenase-like lactoylglutathione lyase family enzyme
LLTHVIVSNDVERSRRFYTEVLGGETVFHGDTSKGEPSIIALANGWVTINVGGGLTADKPTVTLEAPTDLDHVSAFLNIRVADIHAVIPDWGARGAEFLTPPIDRGVELRCYMRDPDGHLIEVGQATGTMEGIPESEACLVRRRRPAPADGLPRERSGLGPEVLVVPDRQRDQDDRDSG